MILFSFFYTLYMYGLIIMSIGLVFPAVGVLISVLPKSTHEHLLHGMTKSVVFLSFIRVKTRGVDTIDWKRGYVIMFNHVNLFDHFELYAALPIRCRGLESADNFKIPFYGWLMKTIGSIPLDRKNIESAKKAMELAKSYLYSGIGIAILPEGTRTRTGLIGPFKKGGFHLAIDTQSPILPITINGAYDVQHKGKFLMKPGKVEFIVHPPIETKGLDKSQLALLMEQVRNSIEGSFIPPKCITHQQVTSVIS